MTDSRRTGAAGSGVRFSRRRALAMAAAWCASAPLHAAAASTPAPAGPLDHLMGVSTGRTIGSAFFLTPTIAATNAHVVAGLGPGDSLAISDATGRRSGVARLIARSDRMDLALLAAPEGLLPPVAEQDAPKRTGLAVRAAGVDLRARDRAALELRGNIAAAELDLPKLGRGAVVRLPGVRRGFSGGPVLDLEGRLVGMIASIRVSSGGSTASPRQSAFTPLHILEATEAFVLRATDIRREAEFMLKRHRA